MQLARHFSRTNATVPAYEEYLDQIQFAPEPALGTTYTRATPDSQNTGVYGPTGERDPTEFHMYVDDNNYAETSIERMKLAIRYSIHALMTLIGETIPTRAPGIAPDKFWRATISDVRRLLGFDVDTSQLLMILPKPKRYKLVAHLDEHWKGKHQTTLQVAGTLVGTLVNVVQTTTWGRLLFINLHRSISDCLRKRARELLRHPKFRALRLARDEEWQRTSMSSRLKWFNSKLGQFLWLAKARINISEDMAGEVEFLRWALLNLDWQIPIAHKIPRDWDFQKWGDACLLGAGGYSLDLEFWWALDWPEDIVRRSRLPGAHPDYISINLLEFAALIIGFAASIAAWNASPVASRPPHPIVGIFTDNTTALSWSQKLSVSKTIASRALARILVSMMMGAPVVGLRTEYIPGPDNIIADFLSRLKHLHILTDAAFYFTMVQKFPALRTCRRFLPNSDLLSLIYSALCGSSLPRPKILVELGQLAPR
jgi:hypothetical protein